MFKNIFNKNLNAAVVFVILSGVVLASCSQPPADQSATTDQNNSTSTTTDTNTNSQVETNQEPDPEVEEEAEPAETPTNTTTETQTTTDFSKFSQNRQEIGAAHAGEYSLTNVLDSAMTGFHRFTFEITPKGTVTEVPHATAQYRSDLGSIRVDLDGITTDAAVIHYQAARNIDKEGVIKIYHNISPDSTEELYDIGVSKITDFYFSSQSMGSGKWQIILDVKYPGAVSNSVDLGSTSFSQNKQQINGGSSAQGISLTKYSYGSDAGALKFIFYASSTSSTPLPTVTAEYNSNGNIDVIFPSLTSDKILSVSPPEQTLYGPVSKVIWGKSGGGSKYTFVMNKKSDFKLSALTNPNQVIIEIKQ